MAAAAAAAAAPARAMADGGHAAALARLDAKNGFRGATLGATRAQLGPLLPAGRRGPRLLFRRAADKLSLFHTRLATVLYELEDGVLERIVVTGAWTVDPTMRLCEGNKDHVADNLRQAFGPPTGVHGYSSHEGRRCVRRYGGGLDTPYCRVLEWRTKRVRLLFFGVSTTSPAAPPPQLHQPAGWRGYSCRFILEYSRITDPVDDL